METPDPEYISIDFELTHCKECSRELDRKGRCYHCEELLQEEVNREYLRNLRHYHNDMGV